MNGDTARPHADRYMIFGLALALAAYLAVALVGWPQAASARLAKSARDRAHGAHAAEAPEVEAARAVAAAPFWMVLPFGVLLASIAFLPLSRFRHWWDSNRHKLYVSAGLGLATLLYYLLVHGRPVAGHWPVDFVAPPPAAGANWPGAGAVLVNALAGEYFPFVVLLFSLFTIVGGIRVEGDIPAHPLANTAFLAVGAVLASLIGTTGAAMLLIRPLLETNHQRRRVQHTVLAFIFIVCNCGGCLLPLGDPPLFLGYLFGVPFLWTLRLWPAWLLVNGALLAVYFLWDHFWHYPREASIDIRRDEREVRPLRFYGLWPNVVLLGGVILSVALLDPAKPLPGTAWHPWVYLREMVQLGLVLVSLWSSSVVRRRNAFNYAAIAEVAVLFLGIFLCMQPPLAILRVRGPALGLTTPAGFFWASGSLSSVLDNAPTYAAFFETARSLGDAPAPAGVPAIAGVRESLLAALSLGSVFMGAMTYIGNAPNFMVKSIAEKSGVGMPSFFGYLAYSAILLLPLFIVVTFALL